MIETEVMKISSDEKNNFLPSKVKSLPSFCIIMNVENYLGELNRTIGQVDAFLQSLPVKSAIAVLSHSANEEKQRALFIGCKSILTVSSLPEGGDGSITRAGFRLAIDHGFDYAIVLNSGCAFSVEQLKAFFKPMMLSYDYIKATRYGCFQMKNTKTKIERIRDRLVNVFGKYFLGLPFSDCSCDVRAVKCTLLARMMTEKDGVSMLIEEAMQAKRLAAKSTEIPYRPVTAEL